MRDSFTLQGMSYSQQYRKCGKANCEACASGDGHGPYWYARDQRSGARSYVGKELPANVAAAREWHNIHLPAMTRKRRELTAQIDALARLIRNDALSNGDTAILTALGFGDCLVAPAEAGIAQDAPEVER